MTDRLAILPGRILRGIRDKIPQGYILGRIDPGDGPVQLINLHAIVTGDAVGGTAGGGAGLTHPQVMSRICIGV